MALGVARTGRVITAAALVMSISFAALIAAQVSFMRMFGVGLTLAILVDATLVRHDAGAGLHAHSGPVELVGARATGAAARPFRCPRSHLVAGKALVKVLKETFFPVNQTEATPAPNDLRTPSPQRSGLGVTVRQPERMW